MAADSSSVCRAVRLVYMRDLLAEQWYSMRRLAELCGISPRTAQRDLRVLEDSPLRCAVVQRSIDGIPYYRIGCQEE